ncbi:DedA family protein [Desulforamulus aeronauticus]|uniref:Membrane protein DedA, SNARE-associated domain n=1 Tax=Desulforamulus aeronauticus DSM 10349 TaxID=1121421 RepID=A0A1M6R6A2_9FIRM|nr:DedA family protein [Desulforamulus aeronauticus]SHK27956.1 membrane protein DedA, SNARE-associated domain [Desulforamulus aeronauticus DSM 10349]
MVDRILDIFTGLGLPGLFVGIYLEALGLPFPGSVLLALIGFLSRQGQLNIVLAWLVSMLAYILGSVSAFSIGRYLGEPFLKKWGKYIGVTPKRFARAQELLTNSAPGYIIGGRFLPTVGNITPYVAGISGISMKKFLLYDTIHAILWLTTFLGAGALLGKGWQKFVNGSWVTWLAVAGGLLLAFYLVRHLWLAPQKNKV